MNPSTISKAARTVISLTALAATIAIVSKPIAAQNAAPTDTTAANPKLLYNKAVKEYKDGDEVDAVSDLKTYIASAPGDGPARGLLGYLELKAGGQDAAAVSDLTAAVQMDPTDRPTRNNLGSALLRTGDINGAITQFQAVLTETPNDTIAQNNLAGAEAQGGQYQKAVYLYKTIVATGPAPASVHKNYAFCLGKLGDYPQAETQYTKATRLDPSDAAAWVGAGLYANLCGDNASAVDDLAKAIELGPTDPFQARFAYGEALAAEGRLDEALKQFKYASILNAQDFSSFYNIGIIENRLADYDDAETAFRQALALQPGNPDATAGLALLTARNGSYAAESTQLEAVAKQYPSSEAVQAALGTLYADQNQSDLAIQHWKNALTLNAADDQSRLQLATYYVSVKDYAGAVFEYEYLSRHDPKNDAIDNARGLAYEGLVDHRRARAAFSDAVTANPKNAAAWNNLGVCDEELSDLSRATLEYKRALAADPTLAEAKQNLYRIASNSNSSSSPSKAANPTTVTSGQ